MKTRTQCHTLYELTASIAMELQGAWLRNGSIVMDLGGFVTEKCWLLAYDIRE